MEKDREICNEKEEQNAKKIKQMNLVNSGNKKALISNNMKNSLLQEKIQWLKR